MTTKRPILGRLRPALAALVFVVFPGAAAAAGPPDGTGPAVRELYTDRPDKTESPYTVPAGCFQIEADLVSFARHTSGDARTTGWEIAPFNFKAGLLDNLDFQVVVRTYYAKRTEVGASRAAVRFAGSGDVTARAKLNLVGNDAGRLAVGVMPFVKIPTDRGGAGNEAVEGGVIVPLAFELPRGWGLGLMTEVDVLRNDDGTRGHHLSFINSVTIGHDIASRLAGYAEFFSEISRQRGQKWIGTIDLGLTYALGANLQLDGGLNVGVTAAADDINPFIGLSWRF
jgi:hypothetical protein